MNIFNNKIFNATILSLILLFSITTSAAACTYEATITDTRLNFTITSDTDKLTIIQYIRQSGLATVTNLIGPDVGIPWTYFDDPFCNVWVDYPIGCRQIRGGSLGAGAFWQWSTNGYTPYHILPAGIWTLDFDSPPTYESLGIEYGTSGGGQPWTLCTRTGPISTPTPSSNPSPSPSPTPSPSPSLSPTPTPTPTPIPVTKVFLIPGLYASWNADALLNCKLDSSTPWTQATYADYVYNPVITALQNSSWQVLPFYYDWRQKISKNDDLLASYINQKIIPGEKVNVVGHSMGGLIGREYLETSAGEKLNSLLTVGTPHRGSALSYPAWSGGNIWNDNFLAKIATNLFLKHCGNLLSLPDREVIRETVPSTQDLLPIDSYLYATKSLTPPDINSMEAQNTWLMRSPFSNPWGVKVGTISGYGFSTLYGIQVKAQARKDLTNGDWADGKPAGKIYSNEGDGTILTSSALLPAADVSATIPQTHSGLMNTPQGISEILSFLGNSSNLSNLKTPLEPNSALIVIGHPANFVVTDQNGKSQKDRAGMVSFMNPKPGLYKLSLLPSSNNTLFIIAQFLPNGDVKYKEYNLKGFGPKFKTLNFSLENPQEDILN